MTFRKQVYTFQPHLYFEPVKNFGLFSTNLINFQTSRWLKMERIAVERFTAITKVERKGKVRNCKSGKISSNNCYAQERKTAFYGC